MNRLLQILFLNGFIFIFIYISIIPVQGQNGGFDSAESLRLPSAFPDGRYTPHGYLDNPWHSMVFNRSGVIRSVPPLGMAFWKRPLDFPYGGAAGGHINYISVLQMGVLLDGQPLLIRDNFEKVDASLYASYHSKNIMRYDVQTGGIHLAFHYFLADENLLACRVEIENRSADAREMTLYTSNIYGLWQDKWWGSNGLNGQYVNGMDGFINKIWAYGDVFALASDFTSTNFFASNNRAQWLQWQHSATKANRETCIVKGRGPLHTTLAIRFRLQNGDRKSGYVYLVRAANSAEAQSRIANAQEVSDTALQEKMNEDRRFWQNCPQLVGDWPEHWKHGWVYDWETLRMNVRRPVGIFNHPWDGMQIQSPRLVLGETAIDMFTMSYGDMDRAKEVLYGTFADAVMPNVPCVREDGSMNMIGADGSECGTAPMWGFPFHAIESVYERSHDRLWLRKLYPHLKEYLDWWLQNRTDEAGWFHCNNSWESGQDGSRRFLVEGEGDPATFVRTVDVEASMAEAFHIMAHFAETLNMGKQSTRWRELEKRHRRHTRSMFVDGWYRDIDGRNGQPIILEDFYDPIMLAPLTCRLADSVQINEVRPQLEFILEHPQWLEWPPKVLAFAEAAVYADMPAAAAEAITSLAERIYRRTDAPRVKYQNEENPYQYRIPGVACEYWPVPNRPAGGEAYGWGATLPMFIIRHVIGFRENVDSKKQGFYLQPAVPASFMGDGKSIGIKNLRHRQMTIDLQYDFIEDNRMQAALKIKAPHTCTLTVFDSNGNRLTELEGEKSMDIRFDARRGQRYWIEYRY